MTVGVNHTDNTLEILSLRFLFDICLLVLARSLYILIRRSYIWLSRLVKSFIPVRVILLNCRNFVIITKCSLDIYSCDRDCVTVLRSGSTPLLTPVGFCDDGRDTCILLCFCVLDISTMTWHFFSRVIVNG